MSSSSALMNAAAALNELLDDENAPNDAVLAPPPVAEPKPRRTIGIKAKKAAAAITEAPAAITEAPVVAEAPAPIEKDADAIMEETWAYVNSQSTGLVEFVEKYKALLADKALKAVAKAEKESDLPEGLHYRMVDGEKRKCQYVRDNGVSLYKVMKEGDKVIGVSCAPQKGARSIKTAEYTNLVWVSKTIVKNLDNNVDYPHKDGKVMFVIDGTAISARLMVVRE